MSRDSGSWRSAWRQTPEPPQRQPQALPRSPGVLVSPCGQLCTARACGAPSPAVAGRPWLPSALVCPRVMCAEPLMPSKHPQPRPTWGLASSCPPGHRVARSKPGRQLHSLGALRQDPGRGCGRSSGREPDRVQHCLQLQGAKATKPVFVPTSPTAVSRFPHHSTLKKYTSATFSLSAVS